MKAPIDNADFGKTVSDYLMHRVGFPASLFARLREAGLGTNNQRVVDLGTGTGTLGRGLALQGCKVTGVDPAVEMLKAARLLDSASGINSSYVVGTAEETSLPSGAFDLVSAGQCWHWFDAGRASLEIRRILKPGGQLLIAYYDWLPLKGNVVRRTEELIEQYNPHWRGGNLTGIHPGVFRDLGENEFEKIESFTYDESAVYSHESWRGRIRASAGISATLDAEAVGKFDSELAALLEREFPNEPMATAHRVFVVHASVT